RGIAQAENVTRLTELAFVFIPMSFAAAVFSMQTSGAGGNPTEGLDVYCYGTALGFVVLAYLPRYVLRVALRSRTMSWRIQEVGRKIRSERQAPDGVPVPAHRAFWV
ncbi:hypothetical protein QBC41DRAFT_198875, partial [Cercophora samala]